MRFFRILDTKSKICISGKLYLKLLIITQMESAINKEQTAVLIHAVKTGFGINDMGLLSHEESEPGRILRVTCSLPHYYSSLAAGRNLTLSSGLAKNP